MLRWFVVLGMVFGFSIVSAEKDEKDEADKVMEAMKKIQKLKKMTSFLNLLNGLYLSEEQMRKILKVNMEYKEELEEWMLRNKERVEEGLRLMEEWVEALKEGKLPKDLMRRVGRVDHMFGVMKKRVLNRIRTRYKERLEEIFTEAQKEVIKGFKPCVVPPRDLRDPIRAGQAKTGGRYIRLLERLRRLPPNLFHRALDKIVDRHIQNYAKRHPMTDEEKAAERKRIRKILLKIYRMDDVEFEIQKGKLAEELKVRDKGHIIREEIKRLNQELNKWTQRVMPGYASPVARWFLNPDIVIPTLKARLDANSADRKGQTGKTCLGKGSAETPT